MLELMKKRKRNWLGRWLRRNCLPKYAVEKTINKSMALQPRGSIRLKWLLPDGSTMALWHLWLEKRINLNLNFGFLNRILLLFISIVLARLGGPHSRPYTTRKISRVQPRIEPGTSWMAVRCANHYTKQVVKYALEGMVNGKKIRGRSRYQMIDNIMLNGLYADTKRKAEDRVEWRMLSLQ